MAEPNPSVEQILDDNALSDVEGLVQAMLAIAKILKDVPADRRARVLEALMFLLGKAAQAS